MAEQIRFDGRPERRGPEIKVEENGIIYDPDNRVSTVKMGWQGGDDFMVMNVRLHSDGSFAKFRCWAERFGRMASEAEAPSGIKEKAISMACGIYQSHERAKERVVKKEKLDKEQMDLDFGDESEE